MEAGTRSATWTAEEVERERGVRLARVRRDAARGIEANLEELVALTRFGNELARGFSTALVER